MNVELKSCPFCGGKAKLSKNKVVGGYDYSLVFCSCCGVKTQTYEISTDYCSNEKAINDWNRRVEKNEG